MIYPEVQALIANVSGVIEDVLIAKYGANYAHADSVLYCAAKIKITQPFKINDAIERLSAISAKIPEKWRGSAYAKLRGDSLHVYYAKLETPKAALKRVESYVRAANSKLRREHEFAERMAASKEARIA